MRGRPGYVFLLLTLIHGNNYRKRKVVLFLTVPGPSVTCFTQLDAFNWQLIDYSTLYIHLSSDILLMELRKIVKVSRVFS